MSAPEGSRAAPCPGGCPNPWVARISHHLTAEARDRPAITSVRLLAVLNVGFNYGLRSRLSFARRKGAREQEAEPGTPVTSQASLSVPQPRRGRRIIAHGGAAIRRNRGFGMDKRTSPAGAQENAVKARVLQSSFTPTGSCSRVGSRPGFCPTAPVCATVLQRFAGSLVLSDKYGGQDPTASIGGERLRRKEPTQYSPVTVA